MKKFEQNEHWIFLYWLVFASFLAFLITVATIEGYVEQLFYADRSKIVFLIAGLYIYGTSKGRGPSQIPFGRDGHFEISQLLSSTKFEHTSILVGKSSKICDYLSTKRIMASMKRKKKVSIFCFSFTKGAKAITKSIGLCQNQYLNSVC